MQRCIRACITFRCSTSVMHMANARPFSYIIRRYKTFTHNLCDFSSSFAEVYKAIVRDVALDFYEAVINRWSIVARGNRRGPRYVVQIEPYNFYKNPPLYSFARTRVCTSSSIIFNDIKKRIDIKGGKRGIKAISLDVLSFYVAYDNRIISSLVRWNVTFQRIYLWKVP